MSEDKYDHPMPHHEPSEGFDRNEPAASKIFLFVVVSVVTLVAMILAVQAYFDKIWNEAVYEKVLNVPGEEWGELHSLEAWRLAHYEYPDATKKEVRLPYDRAKELFLKEAAEGKTFYPGKPTEPKPEEPVTPDSGKAEPAKSEPAKSEPAKPAAEGKQ
jgi:hypothetical protein